MQSGIIQSYNAMLSTLPTDPAFAGSLVLRLLPSLTVLLLSSRRPLIPTLILTLPSIILHRHSPIMTSSACSSVHLALYVRPKLDVLVEIADVAADDVVGLQAEGYERNEA